MGRAMRVWFAVLMLAASFVQQVSSHGEQPLARIAVQETAFALDGRVSIKASPSVLGARGQNVDWVLLEYSSPNPSNNDWVGVFSPANFSASTRLPENRDVIKPLLCSAPIKYQYAHYSSPAYPKLVAVSNTVAFANPKAPVYPRLAQGKEWNEMTVTWTSGYGIAEAEPFVEWGRQDGEKMRSPAGTLTVDSSSMCGE